MLKWAMRIVAVGGAMLALAVGTAAWLHRTEGRWWEFGTPSHKAYMIIFPGHVQIDVWKRSEDPADVWAVGRYGVRSSPWGPRGYSDIRGDFGFTYGARFGGVIIPSFTGVLCPDWAVIAVLLLPMGLWAGIGWRQRRRAKAGHCANCGYDLRATPEKCPECGRAVRIRSE